MILEGNNITSLKVVQSNNTFLGKIMKKYNIKDDTMTETDLKNFLTFIFILKVRKNFLTKDF